MMRANRGHGNLRILLPMITTVSEVDRALALIRRAHRELAEEGHDVSLPPIGAMIEVPSAVYQARSLAERLDFLSVGANDLTQYLMAVDRGNAGVAGLYDSLHPAVLGSIRHAVRGARSRQCPVSLCGTMASDPAAAVFFPALGLEAVAAVTSGVLRIKAVVRALTLTRSRDLLDEALRLDGADEVRTLAQRALDDIGLGELTGPRDVPAG